MAYQNFKLIIATVSLTAGLAARGQDVYVDNSAATQNAYINSHINGLVLKNVAGKDIGNGYIAETYLTYNPSVKIRDRAVDRMISKSKINASTAAAMRKTNINELFDKINAVYNLKHDDAADILTAYQVLNWQIANNVSSSKPAPVNAYRNLIISVLQKNREIARDAGNRAMLGEETKITFLMLYSEWQNAKKAGKAKAFSDQLNQEYQKQNKLNLRALKLDEKGLHQ